MKKILLVICTGLLVNIILANCVFSAGTGEAPNFFPTDPELASLTLIKADVFSTVAYIINWSLTFLGMLSLVLILYAGLLWIWARGNEEEIDKAKEILKGSFIGLVIILSAYSISYFVFTNIAEIVSSAAVAEG